MKKVLVTGGAGFIGSHTVIQLLRAGYEPVIVDNFCNSQRGILQRVERIIERPVTLHEVDCCDGEAMSRVFEAEGPLFGVIHFAAHKAVGVSVKRPLDYYENNLGSLTTLLRVMRESKVKHLVFSSSCTVYGQPDALPVTEQSPVKRAESPYGRTKQFCEEVISDHVASEAPLRSVILRYFNPIGAHESGLIGELPIGAPENLVPYITQTAVGIREALTVFGNDYPTPDGTCIRDYIHVVDLADAHVAALEWLGRQESQSLAEIFNVGTGKGTSVLEAITAFEQANQQALNTKIGPRREGDVIQTYASVDKASQMLGWRAKLGLNDAMRDAYHWQLRLAEEPLD